MNNNIFLNFVLEILSKFIQFSNTPHFFRFSPIFANSIQFSNFFHFYPIFSNSIRIFLFFFQFCIHVFSNFLVFSNCFQFYPILFNFLKFFQFYPILFNSPICSNFSQSFLFLSNFIQIQFSNYFYFISFLVHFSMFHRAFYAGK